MSGLAPISNKLFEFTWEDSLTFTKVVSKSIAFEILSTKFNIAVALARIACYMDMNLANVHEAI